VQVVSGSHARVRIVSAHAATRTIAGLIGFRRIVRLAPSRSARRRPTSFPTQHVRPRKQDASPVGHAVRPSTSRANATASGTRGAARPTCHATATLATRTTRRMPATRIDRIVRRCGSSPSWWRSFFARFYCSLSSRRVRRIQRARQMPRARTQSTTRALLRARPK